MYLFFIFLLWDFFYLPIFEFVLIQNFLNSEKINKKIQATYLLSYLSSIKYINNYLDYKLKFSSVSISKICAFVVSNLNIFSVF